MNMKKKLDRMGQWGKEKMGGEVKTNTSEDFRALETEMNLRHEGTTRLVSKKQAAFTNRMP